MSDDEFSLKQFLSNHGLSFDPDDAPNFKREPKDKRKSARGKLRRRIDWLQHAMDQVEDAIRQVREAPGRTNRSDKLDQLDRAISEFRQTAALPPPRVVFT